MSAILLKRRYKKRKGGVTPPPENPGNGWTDQAAYPGGINLANYTFAGGSHFATDAPLGQAGNIYPMVRGYDFSEDTSKNMGRPAGQRGMYRSSKTTWVANSLYNCKMHYDTVDSSYYIGAITPDFEPGWGQLYGKWACRFRRDAANSVGGGYKVAYLLWPAVNTGDIDPKGYTVGQAWDYGEIDLPENLGFTEGFIHYATGSGDNAPTVNGSKRHGNAAIYRPGTWLSNDWHTYSYEWIPGRVQFFVDGQLVLTHTGEGVPYVKMFWAMQNETRLSATPPVQGDYSTVQVDWIAQWSYTPGSAATV